MKNKLKSMAPSKKIKQKKEPEHIHEPLPLGTVVAYVLTSRRVPKCCLVCDGRPVTKL
jgi:hypothetical protein